MLQLSSTVAQMYLSAFESEDWDICLNGEGRFLSSIVGLSPDCFTAFDVGCYAGQWAKIVLDKNEHAQVHCFEVVDHLYRALKEDMARYPGATVNQLGLWSSTSTLTGQFVSGVAGMSSLIPDVWQYTGEWQRTGDASTPFHVGVERGDDYCDRNGVTHIDFLKVDVEGAEFEVLRGFERLFSAGQIDVVQFEYGPLALAVKTPLKDFFDFFSNAGMLLGKVYPRYVKLMDRYFPGLDDFRWANYVALRPTITERLPKDFGSS